MRTIAPCMPPHDFPAALPEVHAEVFCRRRHGKNMCRCWSALRNAKANPLFAGEFAGVGFASILRTLLPAAPPASPVSPALAPARGIIGLVSYTAAFFLFLISAATAGGRTTVQTVSATAKTLPTTPTRER